MNLKGIYYIHGQMVRQMIFKMIRTLIFELYPNRRPSESKLVQLRVSCIHLRRKSEIAEANLRGINMVSFMRKVTD